MNERQKQVFSGWVNLTQAEKDDLVKEINAYENMTLEEKRKKQLRESVKAVDTGPYSGATCLCCGR